MHHQHVTIDLSATFPNESSHMLNDLNVEDATEKVSDDNVIVDLIEEDNTLVNKGDDGTSISKSFVNI